MNRFHLEIQFVPESVTLLNMVAQPAPYITDYMNRMSARYGIQPDARACRIVELLQEIEDTARAEFATDMKTVRFYCESELESEKTESFANLLLLTEDVNQNHRTVAEQQQYLNEMTEQEYITHFYEELKSYGTSTVDDSSDDTETVADVVDIIFQMNISDARKLHLQQLFFHRKEHMETLMALMLRAEKILRKYAKKLEAFGRELMDYVEADLQGESIFDYIVREFYYNLSIPTVNKDCDIYVSYLKCASVGFFLQGETIESVVSYARIGVIFSRDMSFRNMIEHRAALSEEKVVAMLKLLADKSKFQILSATVDEPAYGSQLATMLGLTTATISHHTSALLEQELLTLDKVDTKIYYRTNPVMVRALIQYLQDKLLHEQR